MRRFLVTLAVVLALTACTSDDPTLDVPRRDAGGAAADAPSPSPSAASAPAPVPEARTEVGAARLGDGSILVVGGLRGDGTATARADRYDVGAARWTAAPPLPEPLHHPGVASFGERVFVAGGYTSDVSGTWTETADVWSLGPGDDAWRAEPPLGNARGALGLAASGSRLVAFGGTSDGQVVASVEVLREGTDGWRRAPPMARAREHLAAASADGRVYAIAGRVGGLETNLATVESFDPAAFNGGWRSEPPLTVARGGIAGAAVDGTVCVAGGEAPPGTIASVECLTGGAWRVVAELATARHGLGVVAGEGRRLHVLAGGPKPGLFVSDAHEVLPIP